MYSVLGVRLIETSSVTVGNATAAEDAGIFSEHVVILSVVNVCSWLFFFRPQKRADRMTRVERIDMFRFRQIQVGFLLSRK